MHDFNELNMTHLRLYKKIAAGEDINTNSVYKLLGVALKSSANIQYIEDREELRHILRFWGNYLSALGEKFPDIDIDTPGRKPAHVLIRPDSFTNKSTPSEEDSHSIRSPQLKKKSTKQADVNSNFQDPPTRELLYRAQQLKINTIFDRAATINPCHIGGQGVCCSTCSMGPCRLPLPKNGIQKEDSRIGICGATANIIAAHNFARMFATGAAAHSEYGLEIAKSFLAIARREIDYITFKDHAKLEFIAEVMGIETVTETSDDKKNIDELALMVAEKMFFEWFRHDGELSYLKRAPKALYDRWTNLGIKPQNIDRDIINIMNRTGMDGDQDYKSIIKQCSRAALADGWGSSMIASDLQDVIFGSPYPLQTEADIGVLGSKFVNIVIQDIDPILAEMLLKSLQDPKTYSYARSKGAQGIQLSGICCNAIELMQRHGIPIVASSSQQELVIITGACEVMVVDNQCNLKNLANVAKCFHTKLITTRPFTTMKQNSVINFEVDPNNVSIVASKIVQLAIENFQNRNREVVIPNYKSSMIVGFGVESIQYHFGGTFHGSYYTLNDNIINGRIRGVVGMTSCSNVKADIPNWHVDLVRELIRNDVIVFCTGCAVVALASNGLLIPENNLCGPGLTEVCETVGIPPVLHLGSCMDNARILLAASEMVKVGGLGNEIYDLPLAFSIPMGVSEKFVSIGHYMVSSGVYTIFGSNFPISGAPEFENYMCNKIEYEYGGKWDFETESTKHATKILDHINKKRVALGIDKARERILQELPQSHAQKNA